MRLRIVSFFLLLLLIAPAIASAAQHQIVLRFRYWGDPKEIAVIQQTIDDFERDHPGVTVHGERITAQGDEYIQKLVFEQAAGLTPDVIFCGNNFQKFAGDGILTSLNQFIERDPSVKLSDYYPEVVDGLSLKGQLYALPRDVAPMGLLYYNKKLFDQAHIPYPTKDWSWDYTPHPERGYKDFLTVAKALTHPAHGDSPAVFGYSAGDPTWTMDNCLYSTGAGLVDDAHLPKKITMDDPRVVKAMQFTQDLSYKYKVSPSTADLQSSGLGTAGAHELFADGRLAMYVCGIWEVPRFRQEITTFDWDIAQVPLGPTGKLGVQTGFSGYGMSKACRHKELAWELIKYLAGPIGLSNLAKAGLAQPAIQRLANSPLWLDNNRPHNRKLTIEEVPYVHLDVASPIWDEIYTEILQPKEQLVWNGTLTAQQAISAMLPEAQQRLNEYNNPPPYPKLNWTHAIVAMIGIALLVAAWVGQGVRNDLAGSARLGAASERRAGWAFISPWLIGTVVFLLAPVLVSLILSFTSWDMISPAKFVGIDNFKAMAVDLRFWDSLKVTLIYTLFAVPLGVIGSLLLALLLNAKISGQPLYRTMFYIPSIVSAVAASLIFLRIFDPDSGLLNGVLIALHIMPLFQLLHLTDPGSNRVSWLLNEHTALGSLIFMSLWGIGGGMVIYLAGLQGIPQSYYEAADIDGANVVQKFRHVTLPLLTPTIFFTLIMGVIGSFQVFAPALVMSNGGPNNATLFYVLYLYQNAFQYLKMGYASGLAWVLFLIILAVTAIQLRTSRWVHYEGAER